MRPLHVWPLGLEQRKKNNPGEVYAGAEAEAYASPGQGVGRGEPGMRPLHVWPLGLEQRKKYSPGKGCVGVQAEAPAFPGQGVELLSPPGRGAGGRPKGAGVGMVHAVSQNSKNLKD